MHAGIIHGGVLAYYRLLFLSTRPARALLRLHETRMADRTLGPTRGSTTGFLDSGAAAVAVDLYYSSILRSVRLLMCTTINNERSIAPHFFAFALLDAVLWPAVGLLLWTLL